LRVESEEFFFCSNVSRFLPLVKKAPRVMYFVFGSVRPFVGGRSNGTQFLDLGTGREKWKTAPLGVFPTTHHRPPSASTMDRQTDSPIPIPLLLLVKNGSKMRFSVSGSIPGPESSMATMHSPVSVASDLSRKMREPGAVELMASIAFVTKLKMTCCN